MIKHITIETRYCVAFESNHAEITRLLTALRTDGMHFLAELSFDGEGGVYWSSELSLDDLTTLLDYYMRIKA